MGEMFTVLKGKPRSTRDFDAIRISLVSPDKIREWSYGEVKKAETINYRTFKPERDGLFCARIFGPVKDYECLCRKYKGMRYKGVVCEKCGVEVTEARVRRERMGHIELATPVAHIWYLRSIPSIISLLLDIKLKDLERVIYYESYITIKSNIQEIPVKKVLSEKEYREAKEKYGDGFVAEMGASAVRKLLEKMDIDALHEELQEAIRTTTLAAKKKKIVRRARIIEKIKRAGSRPEWMILEVLPVLPPDLRPLVSLESGRFASSDLNDLYRRVINRNNRLKRLIELGAPSIIVRNEKRMLQEAVDALLDNGRRKQVVRASNNRPLKSLSDSIKGKSGRFRRNLLGKRVDYSGRSVIIVGPELKLDQCGLPRVMALELFKPFIYNKLIDSGLTSTIKGAKKMVERKEEVIWDILEEIVKEYPVLLNRAPTLHRLSIQAFHPVLTKDKAIQLHPLVCPAFNADFDGDQMAIHVPLSPEAKMEAEVLMLSPHGIISPASGNPIAVPTQDMVLGIYYMTKPKDGAIGEGMLFSSPDEVISAYDNDMCSLNASIKVRINGKMVNTTTGRVVLAGILPEGVPFELINKTMKKKDIVNVVNYIYKNKDLPTTTKFLDDIKEMGFRMATKAGISISLDDIKVPEEKERIVKTAEERVRAIAEQYRQGLLTDMERYNKVVDIWSEATDKIADVMMKKLGGEFGESFNPIYVMADSGARGSAQQIRQLAGARGLMAKPSGDIIETPIKSNFKEGLSTLEYFISAHGARKGLADTALKTANAGYLTRKLVDVAQDVMITTEDCGSTEGMYVSAIITGGEEIESLRERIAGRTAAEDVINPFTKEIIVKENEIISDRKADEIVEAGIKRVKIHTVLTCKMDHGVCAKCYGLDLARGEKVEAGEAVGIIAAQSIGEPGTQLTLRTFHIGGTASKTEEKMSAETSRAGIVRFCNLEIAENSSKERIVLSRRDACILITEPQIVATGGGKIKITEDTVNYSIRVGDNESYTLKKVDFVTERDVVGKGAEEAIGKLMFTAKDGDVVSSGSLLVERILEIWDVPRKIPYGSRIHVNDGETLKRFVRAEEGGEVFLYALSGDKLVEIDDFPQGKVDKHGTHVFIKKNDKIVERHYVPKGSIIYVKKGSTVKSGELIVGFDDEKARQGFESDPELSKSTCVLSEWDAYSDFILVSVEGYVKYLDIEQGKTFKEDIDRVTGLRNKVIIESRDPLLRPRITIVDKDGSVKKLPGIEEEAVYYLPTGTILLKDNGDYVKAGDEIGKIPKELIKTTDITGGLPRANELFEAKAPKNAAVVTEINGVVSYGKIIKGRRVVVVTSPGGTRKEYIISRDKRLLVYPGDRVEMGEPLTDGVVNPHDILRILGERALQKHLVDEIQQVYRLQGVNINDKHIEIIVRQMLSKVIIEDAGDTSFMEDEVVNRFKFMKENQKMIKEGKKPAIGRIVLLGITKAALSAESFVSAASFQETTRVLREASISGAIDPLKGLKENVIVGRLIPAGTGQRKFDEISIVPKTLDK